MKTIKSNETIAFNAITIEDAICLLPLMNKLASNLNDDVKSIKSAKESGKVPEWQMKNYKEELKRFNLLRSLGFVASEELNEL